MDFDWQWLLIGLPVAFALGWLGSRFDLRQFRRDIREAPRAYFKGLNLLLNEQHDEAIDAFIEAVQHDPDTSELHFALGNLFRRRGEFERAVRVHQHLMQRADLKPLERQRAQRALAEDFMKAGLFDRAEDAWRALLGTPYEGEARAALLSLHERSRDWPRAIELALAMQAAGSGPLAGRIAHYHCEQAESADAQGRPADADAALQQAMAIAPESPRPWVLAGLRHARAGRAAEALTSWDTLRERQPGSFGLIAAEYAAAAVAAGLAIQAREALLAHATAHPGTPLLQALATLDDATGYPARTSLERWARQLHDHPTLAAAAIVLDADPDDWPGGTLDGVRHAVDSAAAPLARYRCAACGFEAQHYFWQCPGCLSWDSYPPHHLDAL